MSSTNKTSLGLNMWEGSDKPVRKDFVEDNRIIDENLTQLNRDLTTIANNFFELSVILEDKPMQTINFPSGLVRPPFLLAAQIQLYEGIWSDFNTLTGFTNLACNTEQFAINKTVSNAHEGYWVRFLFKK